MTETTAIQIGSKVIVTKFSGARPQICSVCKVTKTGRFRVEEIDNVMFNPISPFGNSGSGVFGNNYSWGRALTYVYSDEKLAELNSIAITHEQHQREEEEKRQKERDKIKQRDAERLADTMAVVKFGDFNRTDLPDGSRLYQGYVPIVKDSWQMSGYIYMIARCIDSTSSWRNADENVECAITYCTSGHSGSFPSGSSTYYSSDEEAVMQSASWLRHY